MKTSPEGILKQVVLAMSASLGYLTIGLVRGWSSTGIPSMGKLHPYLIEDKAAVSWVSAVPPLGAFIGSLVSGPMLHNLGRKKTLMLSGPLFVCGWVLLGSARKTILLIVARTLTGFCAGLVTPSAQVYVSECAYPSIRGLLGSLPALFMAIGVLVSYVLGTWLHWHYLSYASALFPAIMTVLLIQLPESPTWLRDHGREKEADIALKWLDQKHKVSSKENPELYTIETSDTGNENKETENSSPKNVFSREALLNRSVLIPFGLVVGVLVFQQISGIDTIIFYTVEIFHSTHSTINDYAATIIVGLVQVIATLLSIFVIDRIGRKPLLIVSGLLMGVSMSILGFYFYFSEINSELTSGSAGLIPVISLIIFMFGFSIGYCNIPFLLMGELLPLSQRSILSSIASAVNLGSMFLVIKTYPDVKYLLGDKGAFWLYSLFCFASCIFVTMFLPETKQKSLEEIEEYFKRPNTQENLQQKETSKL